MTDAEVEYLKSVEVPPLHAPERPRTRTSVKTSKRITHSSKPKVGSVSKKRQK